MTCSEFKPLLDDLVDGALSVSARTRADEHLLGCPSCRLLVADLRRIRETARKLPPMTPPAHLWASVQQRLDEEDRRAARASEPEPVRDKAAWWRAWLVPSLATAALLVMAVSTALYLRPASPVPTATTASAPAATGTVTAASQPAHASDEKLVQSIESELQLAAGHYEKAITGLEQAAREGQGALDPTVAAVLQKNLEVTDRAIAESRAALTAQPTSVMAATSLFGALRSKVDLLQETVRLINEMRQGNQAAAARIVGDMGKKL